MLRRCDTFEVLASGHELTAGNLGHHPRRLRVSYAPIVQATGHIYPLSCYPPVLPMLFPLHPASGQADLPQSREDIVDEPICQQAVLKSI